MAPKQATLGKFFTLPPGTKPPVPQQTRLKATDASKVKRKGNKSEGNAEKVVKAAGAEEKEKAPLKEKASAKGLKPKVTHKREQEGKDEDEDLTMSGTSEGEEVKAAAKGKKKNEIKEEKEKDEDGDLAMSGTSGSEGVKAAPKGKGKKNEIKEEKDEDGDLAMSGISELEEVKAATKGKKEDEKKEGAVPKEELEKKNKEKAAPKENPGKGNKKKGRPKKEKNEKKEIAVPEEEPEEKSERKEKAAPKEELEKKNKEKAAPEEEPGKGNKKKRRPRKGNEKKEKAAPKEEAKEKKTVPTKRSRSLETANVKEEPAASSEGEQPVTKRVKVKLAPQKAKTLSSPEIRTASSPKPTKRKKAVAVKAEESDNEVAKTSSAEESAGEEGAVTEDDDEKPAVSTKERTKVQKALLTKTTHPHPDWPAGSPTPYSALVKTFTLLEGTTKRLEKMAHTSLFLRQVLRLTPDDLLMVVHLMINKIAADYEGIELGIGESLLMKAIGKSCGRSMDKIKEDQRECGDLGLVAMKSRNNQGTIFAPKLLTVQSVHKALLDIATVKGEGVHGKKVSGINKLLTAAKGDEAKYLVRGLEGKLRIGLAEKTVIASLSQAVVAHEAEKKGKTATTDMFTVGDAMLREVFCELPSYESIIPAMMKHGIMNLKETCKLRPGVPLKPMLAKPTKAISEVLDRFEGKRFTCEYKYDGERAQIHFVSPTSSEPSVTGKRGIARIFSRNSEDLSKKYPDILAALDQWTKPAVESFVLDCEAVAWDKEEQRVLPFQQLMTRKKKDVVIADVKVKVCVFAFDLLYLNGKSLVRESLEQRRKLMQESFQEVDGEFAFAKYMNGNELEQIQNFLDESVQASCEGLMVKMLDGQESGYEPSKRSRNWLKIKKDYLNGIGDSLDLVVLGAYHGRGKRTSVYGAFLLACYNPSSQTYETICNIGTGFSEVNLEEFHTQLLELEIEKPKPYYSHSGGNKDQPDVWFEPKIVWEVKTADLSLSPTYKAAAGLGDDSGKGRGISLRFPRFIRVRDDKGPDQATSSRQVAEMYKKQEVILNGSKGKGGVDDDFEY